ncbi:STE24 endopeptidase [Marmoricola sp. OAE513]|uniref:M48 family metallopeptidase n=1 Tax=Marmoricola sp. OAE513 TaxID=2817894 RepID=UPI001AE24FC8
MEQDSPTGARTGLVVAALAGAVFVVLAVVLVPWHWFPGEHVHAVADDSVFTKAQIEHNEHVGWMFRLPSWANLAIGLGVSLWLGLSKRGSRIVQRMPGPWWTQVLLATGVLTVIVWVAQLPLSARGQQVARSEGLSSQGWGSWLLDGLIGTGVAWAFTAIGVLVVLAIARRAPRTWPAWAAAAGACLAMIGSFVYPVVVEPLFNDFTSLPDGRLRTEIFALAEKEKVPIDDVLVADASRRTTTLNAYVSGFGSTRRVVLYDNVLTDLPRAETEVIVAHELGHAKHDDVLVGTVLGAVGSASGIGLLGWLLSRRRLLDRAGADGPGDPRVIPLVLALAAVGAFVASPVQNTISRAVEARADLTSLEATGDPDTFVQMQRQLTLKSLADPTPPRVSQFWFGSHPTVLQRVGLARLFERVGE